MFRQVSISRIASIALKGQIAPVVAVFLVLLATRIVIILDSTIPLIAAGSHGDACVPARVAYVTG